ncbi:hypothetical protein L798_06709 [Zootermopsis nevadensis]|uniref:Uncharacterized protein n=1 Tax=Zootermopsis nevadensis TaxID=136037 RepID=A0A067RMJ6_ZOONE|nr:hypothetical protein L798_06709 [Zootermopsis nevadensis]
MKNAYKILIGSLKGWAYSKDLAQMAGEYYNESWGNRVGGCGCILVLSDSGQRPTASPCEHGNKPSIKDWKLTGYSNKSNSRRTLLNGIALWVLVSLRNGTLITII